MKVQKTSFSIRFLHQKTEEKLCYRTRSDENFDKSSKCQWV